MKLLPESNRGVMAYADDEDNEPNMIPELPTGRRAASRVSKPQTR